jgi:DNA-binding XRE family transcriptional regulator
MEPVLKIKEILEKNHKSQVWLSQEIDVSVVSVNNWVKNKTNPSLETLYKISKVLKEKISDLNDEE